MPSINRSAIVPYDNEQMYKLINDIEAYPEFLPWCQSSKILTQEEDEIRATLTISSSGIQKSFTTCNRLQPYKMIEVKLIEGPFEHLEGFWRFENLEDKACKVILDLEFSVGSGLMGFVLGPIFHQVANTLVDAFCKRAEDVYGKNDDTH